MTEQEAIRILGDTTLCTPLGQAAFVAIEAIKKLQRYRALGTVEDIKKIIAFLSLDGETGLIDDANLLNQYRMLGTVEELREAKEKRIPKMPYTWGDGYSNGDPVYDMYECPNCGEEYEIDGGKYDFCPKCGQAIDWSEGNDAD